ncbi:pentatricopeptide repeat-containing protein At2g13600-like [Selaginella moellendorffii]|uniref:pentatricopeptide repeat-containing protein At2g13600-like n=1 Tax=Selaginella moellendorffii TaxID=88036 RepID=UPI000D1CD431|nr:pentatricopeptide repeat-containing protein At2g13600-like [Selaginella moellendorffii]|eukprot:XP_024518799.1 pentatricopeptide repeat-containing protein At2g13600-like [Selaginella moellendorffii]
METSMLIGDAHSALHLLSTMQSRNIEPNSLSYVAVLKALCASLEIHSEKEELEETIQAYQIQGKFLGVSYDLRWFLDKGVFVHLTVARRGFAMDLILLNSLIHMYAKCGSLREAQRVFDRMQYHDVISWTSLISGYGEIGELDLVLRLLSLMQVEGIAPNSVTYAAAFKACSTSAERERGVLLAGKVVKVVSLRKAKLLHSQVAKSRLEMEMLVANSLLRMYAKCGSLEEMRGVFDRMAARDLVSWNCMILGYAECGDGRAALELFSEMALIPVVPDARTFVAALKACASFDGSSDGVKALCLEKGMEIHSQIVQRSHGGELEAKVANSLVNMYAKCGSLQSAREVFERMPSRTVVSWNALIFGYAESGDARLAVELFCRMKRESTVRADTLTFAAVLKACGSLGDLETGRKIHAKEIGSVHRHDPVVGSSLVSFYGKCGSVDEARQVFHSMDRGSKDLVTWNSLLEAHSHAGDTSSVLDLFEQMLRERVQVNGVTFFSLLTACSHAGLVDKGREFFELMSTKFGISPNMLHYTCLVDLLGRGNHLDEAVAVVERMPFEPDSTVWASVLGASEKWRNVSIAEMAFESMIKLNDRDAGAYVVMANVYRRAGMVDQSCKVLERAGGRAGS